MFVIFKKLYHKTGLDASIIYTILTRIVQSIGGVVTLLMITLFLDKNEQGYYYTFSSIISIQIFFELGLTTIITQYIAHEAAHLTWKNDIELEGEAYYQSRLASIIRLSIKWFATLAVVMFFVLLFAGNFFFSKYNLELNVQWKLPWLLLSLSTSFIFIINLCSAILEGLGKIKEVARLRFVQQLINIIFLNLFLFAKLKLLSNGLAWLISTATIGIIWFTSPYWKMIRNMFKTDIKWKVDYKKEVLPYQFRIAVGQIGGYFIYQLFNPVLFATQGSVIAGQMGATQTFLNGVLIVSLSWVSTKVALFSNFVARNEFDQLNSLYKKNLFISILVCSAGLIAFILMVYLLKNYYPNLGNRFLSIVPVIFLGLTQLASVIGNVQAFYLRSFKKEPFFVSSIVISLVSAIVTILSSKYYGITGMTIAYFVINGIVGFIWGCIIFRNKSSEWTNAKHQF